MQIFLPIRSNIEKLYVERILCVHGYFRFIMDFLNINKADAMLSFGRINVAICNAVR